MGRAVVPEPIEPGDVLLVDLGEHHPLGHEQRGRRPAVVVGIPPDPVRFPIVVVVPLTSRGGAWVERNPKVYPVLPLGAAGLRRQSVALCDQIRACDVARVVSHLGTLESEQFHRIREGLDRILGS